MLPWYADALYISLYAVLYSLLEIEIEGSGGWAKNLPTVPVIGRFTGYHVLMNVSVIGTIAYTIWPHRGFWHTLFYVTAFFLIEDFMWFVYNPSYGLQKYTKQHVTWHGSCWPWYPSAQLRRSWYHGPVGMEGERSGADKIGAGHGHVYFLSGTSCSAV